MQEMTGKTYRAKKFEKGTYLGGGKVGKTIFIAGSVLGCWPSQRKFGGIIDKPSHYHVVAVDSSAMTSVLRFLKKKLHASEEVDKICIYNMEDDVAQTADAKEAYDMTFYNSFISTVMKIREKVDKYPGVHALHVSGLTGVAAALERGVAGPPGAAGIRDKEGRLTGKGYMDISKWQAFAQQLVQIRNICQVDTHHCIWEGHIEISKKLSQGKDDDAPLQEKVALAGKVGKNWAFNTDHTFRIRREFGDQFKGTEVDKVYLDTAPDGEFESGGRGQDELKPNVYNMTKMYQDLQLEVGGWKGGRK